EFSKTKLKVHHHFDRLPVTKSLKLKFESGLRRGLKRSDVGPTLVCSLKVSIGKMYEAQRMVVE
ncbi:hypothetical protein AMECASPLE_018984, partial [Ameca splendens]